MLLCPRGGETDAHIIRSCERYYSLSTNAKEEIITELYQKQLFSLAILSVKLHHPKDNFFQHFRKEFSAL
jgi:hypothetical protein